VSVDSVNSVEISRSAISVDGSAMAASDVAPSVSAELTNTASLSLFSIMFNDLIILRLLYFADKLRPVAYCVNFTAVGVESHRHVASCAYAGF